MTSGPVHRSIYPEGWLRPSGFANAVVARGTQIFIAGQIGWNSERQSVGDDFIEQSRQALRNVVTLLEASNAEPQHLVRLTWYLTDRSEYLRRQRELGAVYREIVGTWYPAMTAFEVSALIESWAKVEIEATAVVPDP